jgi:hypothetical protein
VDAYTNNRIKQIQKEKNKLTMGCNCGKKKPVVTTPAPIPVSTEVKREDYPDTPEGQQAYELKKWNGGEDIDYFNNIDDYHFKTPNT